MANEWLKWVCGTFFNEKYKWMQLPFRYGDYACATEGHIFVAVRDMTTELPPSQMQGYSWMDSPVPGDVYSFKSLKDFVGLKKPKVEDCKQCKGSGHTECHECMATGKHICMCSRCDNEHEADCEDCDGSGKQYCENCILGVFHGDPKQARIHGRLIDRRLLALPLRYLSADKVTINLGDELKLPLVIDCPEWRIALMAMRDSGEQVSNLVPE